MTIPFPSAEQKLISDSIETVAFIAPLAVKIIDTFNREPRK